MLNYCGNQGSRLEIIIEVYANLASLSRVMKSDGSIDNEADLGNFFLGFSRNTHCTFVDVGSGKEEADERVRGRLLHGAPLFAVDFSCLN